MRGDLDPLVPVLVHSRLAARADMTRALRSVRATNLFEDWERLLETHGGALRPRPAGRLSGRSAWWRASGSARSTSGS